MNKLTAKFLASCAVLSGLESPAYELSEKSRCRDAEAHSALPFPYERRTDGIYFEVPLERGWICGRDDVYDEPPVFVFGFADRHTEQDGREPWAPEFPRGGGSIFEAQALVEQSILSFSDWEKSVRSSTAP